MSRYLINSDRYHLINPDDYHLNPDEFEYWGKMDTWCAMQATCLLLGFDPDADWSSLPVYSRHPVAKARSNLARQIDQRVKGGTLTLSRGFAPPVQFIGWAQQRGIEVPEKLGLIVAAYAKQPTYSQLLSAHKKLAGKNEEIERLKGQLLEMKGNPFEFDKEDDNYPPELDKAIQAWQFITDHPDEYEGTPKQRIKALLEVKYGIGTDSNESERIAIVANPQKSPGRKRTNK